MNIKNKSEAQFKKIPGKILKFREIHTYSESHFQSDNLNIFFLIFKTGFNNYMGKYSLPLI